MGVLCLCHMYLEVMNLRGIEIFLREKMELINIWDAILKNLVGLTIIGKISSRLIDCRYNDCKYLSLFSYDEQILNFW
jgi:hypothetical protein